MFYDITKVIIPLCLVTKINVYLAVYSPSDYRVPRAEMLQGIEK